MLLVAYDDRELRIQLGEGYSSSDEITASKIIDHVIIPQFQEGNPSIGVVSGVDAIARDFFPDPTQSSISDSSSEPSGGQSAGSDLPQLSTSSESDFSGIALAIAALLLGGMGYVGWQKWSNRDRFCPNCQRVMTKLDEYEDDEYLDSGQRAEESLSSRDYPRLEMQQLWRA